MPYSDALGGGFESSLNPMEKVQHGQFYTPIPVCDFMISFAVQTEQDRILEPGCGTGRFLLRALDCFCARSKDNKHTGKFLKQISGVEINHKAAFLAKEQLSALTQMDAKQFDETITIGNFLNPAILSQAYGCFDAIVGNPPYIRYELFDNETRGFWAKAHVPFQDYLTNRPRQKQLFSGKSDSYIAFLLKSTLLLKPGGRLAFITGNSWLSSAQGEYLKHFLTDHYDFIAVIESSVEHWFPEASIIPSIILLTRKTANQASKKIHLYQLNLPLQKIYQRYGLEASQKPGDELSFTPVSINSPLMGIREGISTDYWQKMDKLRQNLLSYQEIAWCEKKIFCVSSDLSGSCEFSDVSLHWNLRTPKQSEMLLPESLGSEFCRSLQYYGKIRYPLKTGINQFFYIEEETIRNYAIESEFLFPVLKSMREVRDYIIQPLQSHYFLFSCPLTKEALEKIGKYGALGYIQWGERQSANPRQKRLKPILWPHLPSVRKRKNWFHVPVIVPADILCSRFFNRRYCFPMVMGDVIEDQTFYGLCLSSQYSSLKKRITILLNTTLSYFWIEHFGRHSLGDGVLQFSRKDMSLFPMLRLDLCPEAEWRQLERLGDTVLNREIYPIEEELQQKDRQELDCFVLDLLLKRIQPHMGKTEINDYYTILKDALLFLNKQRLEMASSRKKAIQSRE